jgi:putative acetyltransferase
MKMLVIRPETIPDYAPIAALHARAFDNRAVEALLVALLRQRAGFDPDLSLVALREGRIVGHALFSAQMVRILGQTVPAVCLAPIAVDPPAQGQGVGGALIAAGHAAARARGYTFSFLLGHVGYYPRFGYHTHAFGDAGLTVATADLPVAQLTRRGPTEADLPALRALWLHEEGAVDLALAPGPDLLDWLSPNPQIAAHVWCAEDTIVGYTRIHAAEPARPRMFLARDHTVARAIAGSLAHESAQAELRLPLHPASASAGAFGPAEARAWQAAMVCPLRPSPFDEYYRRIQSGKRSPGRPLWPVAFELE